MGCHLTTSLEPKGVGRVSVVVFGVVAVAASSFRHHRVSASESANGEHANDDRCCGCHACNDRG